MINKFQAQRELQIVRNRLSNASKMPISEQQKYQKEITALNKKALYYEAAIEADDKPFDPEAAEKELILTYGAISQLYGHIDTEKAGEKFPEVMAEIKMISDQIDKTFIDQSTIDFKYALKRLKGAYAQLDKLSKMNVALIGFEVTSDQDGVTTWTPVENEENPFEEQRPKYEEKAVEQMTIPGVR